MWIIFHKIFSGLLESVAFRHRLGLAPSPSKQIKSQLDLLPFNAQSEPVDEETEPNGDRVLTYDDGSTVTYHADGKITF